MAVEDVHVKLCLQEIVKNDMTIQALIQDIRECRGPLDLLQNLNQNVMNRVQDMRLRIDELERLGKEQDKESDRLLILRDVENHRKQVSSTQVALRKANFTCQMNIENLEKEHLLSGGSAVRQRKVTNKEQLVKSSSNITDSLLSVSRMLDSQVKASEHTNATLISSSKQVSDTQEEFKSMSGHIQNSKKLLTKYSRRELTDKLLIFLALVFFFATVLYIVKKRLFKSSMSSSESL